MKRNRLTTAVLAGIAGAAGIATSASAVLSLNPDGTGQVLIYPYYTVNNGNQTLVSIVNTTNQGKAVKVRFLEGRNSREVLDFNLYLSPFDVWVGAVFAVDETGPGRIATGDTSCTVPALDPGGVPFRNYQYGLPGSGATRDSGPATLDRTREGYIEMIEMAEIVNREQVSLNDITHTAAGVPANCARIRAAWFPPAGYWVGNSLIDTNPPGGGLFGAASIVDAENGTLLSYSADAVDAFSLQVLHTDPGSTFPTLNQANTDPGGDAGSVVFWQGVAVEANYPATRAIDAVSSVFAQSAIMNEYALDEVLLAETEWVVTFPTKRLYVDEFIVGPVAVPPFTRIFPLSSTAAGAGRSCVDIGLNIYDREEGRPEFIGSIDFSPRPPEQVDVPQLCFETTVISFNQTDEILAGDGTAILGSRLASNIELSELNGSSYGYENGWMKIDFLADANHVMRPSLEDIVFSGLPATGFSVQTYVNTNAQPGLLAQYGGLWRHRGERLIQLAIP